MGNRDDIRRRPTAPVGVWAAALAMACSPALGEPAQAAPAPAVFNNAKAGDTATIEGERRLRDPFWPIGYKTAALGSGAKGIGKDKNDLHLERKEARERLRYQGSLRLDGSTYAIINGIICQVGDVLAVRVKGKTFRFRVVYLDANRVKLDEENRVE